ncbi:hypothetical protein HPB52_001766 [Rhipicephalus sanguineus]|uniref:Uncharacterized protein n=1 Tax=Rhipicephalus sanguineus TaxID=34632 RepID=A0A9D4PDB6_RHISA|nr:hypothetical protein HPB52_001766 [Rhipicephalus sanguineus]
MKVTDQSTEFLWAQHLRVLRASIPKKKPAVMRPVHETEDLVLPPDVKRVLVLGPKLAVEPSPTAPKLLALVLHASHQALQEEQERFVSEGVEALLHQRQGNSRIPLKSGEACLEAKSLTVLRS